jgi:tetratricopeptide (TPR) repeat protein
VNLGMALWYQKKFDEAIAVWRELIDRDPKLVEAHVGLARSLLSANKTREAVAAYKEAIAIDPKSAEEHNELAWLLATCKDTQSRDPASALTLAKRAVERDPKNGAYINTLGVARYRTGDWTGAIADLERSMALREGGDSGDWFFIAMARWQLGEKDAAREWYDKAVKWMEKNAPRSEELTRFRNEAAALLGAARG